ncbi:MAG: efflux RND transporter periplasmic adaptor subunit [Candidatus Woesebacteria bacterium]|nr:MAG: efflux RND transporter periplasmic adaptor subunit [Candidatus Woesebacteria bacterium]
MSNHVKILVMSHKRVVIGISLALVAIFVIVKTTNRQVTPTYQTAMATKGALISTVTASGTIVATNNIDVTSTANGQVSKVYVKEGDNVIKGQKLFEITQDAIGQQHQSQAYASYISAKNSLNSANANYYTLQAAAFSANQKFMNDAVSRNLVTTDPTYIQENDAWLASEANFNNVQNSILSSQANLVSAAIAYQQASSTVVSPASGLIQNITVVPGMGIVTSTNSTTVASIQTEGNPVATVNLSQVDVSKVKAGQKVTLRFDSIADATFTGKIAGINKLGTVSSGVTNYLATIEFDSSSPAILPNMSVTAAIITNVKDNVIKVSSSAVQTQNGQSVVRELRNGQLTYVDVKLGENSDTETEIISGVNEGDVIVTSVTTDTGSSSTNSTSPFGGLRGGFGGGGFVRVGGR